MTKKSSKHIYQFLGFMAVISLFIAACGGGGGTSSGSGGGGGISVARVSGTVSAGNATAGLDVEQRVFDSTGAIVAIGNFIMPSAQAQQVVDVEGIKVTVMCDDGTDVFDFTDENGQYDVPVDVEKTTHCDTTFDGVAGPGFTLNPGMKTVLKVSFDGTTVTQISLVQTEGEGTQIEVKDDDDSSDNAKVTVCHKPDTPAEKILSIPKPALSAHLGHGDFEIEGDTTCP